jgi:SAM-dependent methyltransferase
MSTNKPASGVKQRLYARYVTTGQAPPAYAEHGRSGNAPYLDRVIAAHVPADRSVRIADLACGQGDLLQRLRARGYTNVVGVDVSAEQIAAARARNVDGVQQADMVRFIDGRESEFDVVFLMDILEHLDRDELAAFLEKVWRALRPGGTLIAHVPNAEGIFGMRIRYGDLTHETAFTPVSIRQLLVYCGFSDVGVFEDRPVVHGLKSFARRALWMALTLRERLLLLAETGAAGAVLSQNMLVVARKGGDR